MSSLQWSDALVLNLPIMDDTHREFVDMLGSIDSTPNDQLLSVWNELVSHTREHFGREDEWMVKTHFSACHCHTGQHQVVLRVMEEIGQRAANGELELIRELSIELGQWFSQHAQSMDAALALHMRRIDFDPVTGAILKPEALQASLDEGCSAHSAPVEEAEAVAA